MVWSAAGSTPVTDRPASWVDPHFAALYARREEERLAERLVTRMRERAAREPCLDDLRRADRDRPDPDVTGRGGPIRPL